MSIVIDANVAVALLHVDDLFHRSALRRCLQAESVAILNITRAEALIHPTRLGMFDVADAELDRLGVETQVLDNAVASRARELRSTHGNRNFPMVDAVVAALGIERGWTVVTGDAKWPLIPEATIEVLNVTE